MRVALIGDSHAQALWPRVSKRVGASVTVAKPGWSEAKYASSPEPARARGADLVVFQLGGNNREKDPAKYEATVRKLLAAVGRARVVWIGPSTATDGEVGAWHERTAALQAAILPRLGVRWVDSRDVTRAGHRDDGVHFTSAGYDRWADAIVDAVRGAGSARMPWGWLVAGGAVVAAVVVRMRRAA